MRIGRSVPMLEAAGPERLPIGEPDELIPDHEC
jgi:hypothetical protein